MTATTVFMYFLAFLALAPVALVFGVVLALGALVGIQRGFEHFARLRGRE